MVWFDWMSLGFPPKLKIEPDELEELDGELDVPDPAGCRLMFFPGNSARTEKIRFLSLEFERDSEVLTNDYHCTMILFQIYYESS